jgi:MoxR-like ATPase
VPVANHVVDYAVELVAASRPDGDSGPRELHRFIRYGASPRASQCLVLGGKARAVLLGRYHVDFEDIRAVASPVMRHRLALNFQARTENVTVDQIISQLLQTVPTPT